MKSDSLIKTTASLLALSLLATTCFTTVSEAAGSLNGISSQNPVTVSALMIQSLNSKTYKEIVADAKDDKATEVASVKTSSVGQNQEKIKQKSVTVQNANDKKVEASAKTVSAKKVSKYAHTGIAIEDVVNIRKAANTTASIVGRLYKGSAAKIVKSKGEWVYVKSGNVKGYIKKSLLAIGSKAEKIAHKYSKKYAVVNTVTLNVREKASTDSKILVQVGQDEVYRILKGYPEWLKIKFDAETEGYITRDSECVKIIEKFTQAVSMEEILAQQDEDEPKATVKKSKSDDKKSNTKKKVAKKKTSSKKKKATTKKKSSKKKSKKKAFTKKSKKRSSKKTVSTKGKNIVSYALQFVGNPYKYGGSSLTSGTDCSGFTQSIYRNYGYNISRTSRAQYSSAGRIVSVKSLQPGDLLFYSGSGGSVNHVAMYIGGGKVVHASNPRDGIKVSSYNYRTPVRARRVMN